jgi:transcriptional regulator
MSTGAAITARADIMHGTLDLMVLRTLETMGPLHGWGIAQRLEQVSDDALRVNQGTLYPALLRLEQRRLIRSRWGTSENNRRARFYSITAAGRRQLVEERTQWRLVSGIINRLLTAGQ